MWLGMLTYRLQAQTCAEHSRVLPPAQRPRVAPRGWTSGLGRSGERGAAAPPTHGRQFLQRRRRWGGKPATPRIRLPDRWPLCRHVPPHACSLASFPPRPPRPRLNPPASAAPPTPQTSGGVTWRHLPCQTPRGALPLDCSAAPAGRLAGRRAGVTRTTPHPLATWAATALYCPPLRGSGARPPGRLAVASSVEGRGARGCVRQWGGLRDGAPLSEGLEIT